MTIAHVRVPEVVRTSTAAWEKALAQHGHTTSHNCQLMLRVCIDEDGDVAYDMAQTALDRWDELSHRGRPNEAPKIDPAEMRATGRLVYGDPQQCIEAIKTAQQEFTFNTVAAVFNWGGLPHDRVMRSMRLFAKEVIPAFR